MVKERKDLEKVFERIKFNNKYYRVKIKFRKLKAGYSVYYEYWNGSNLLTEFLKRRFLGREDTIEGDDNFLEEVEERRKLKDKQCNKDKNFILKNNEDVADFIEFYDSICKDKPTRPQYETSLKHFKKFIRQDLGQDKISFNELTPILFKKFRKFLLEWEVKKKDSDEKVLKMKPITVRGYLDVMRAGLNIAIEKNIIEKNPLNGIDVKVVETKREHLTEKELSAFINQKTDYKEEKSAFIFSCMTGLRLGDIKKLTFEEIQNDYLIFRQEKTDNFGGLPLLSIAKKIYEKQRDKYNNKGLVFHLPHKTTINVRIKLIAKEAGILKNIHYHLSRHTFAILSLHSGMSIYEVSHFLGHTDIKTTEIYLKFVPEHRKEAMTKLSDLLGKLDIDINIDEK